MNRETEREIDKAERNTQRQHPVPSATHSAASSQWAKTPRSTPTDPPRRRTAFQGYNLWVRARPCGEPRVEGAGSRHPAARPNLRSTLCQHNATPLYRRPDTSSPVSLSRLAIVPSCVCIRAEGEYRSGGVIAVLWRRREEALQVAGAQRGDGRRAAEAR